MWALEAVSVDPTGLGGMTAREIRKSGQLVIQWEFSVATLKSWAWLLATILYQIELQVAETSLRKAQEKNQTEQEIKGMANIHGWCRRLYL
jgi:hypothetical protein